MWKGRRVPDFVMYLSVVGAVVGEAEVGEWEYDEGVVEGLEGRVCERFSDPVFEGYDFIALFTYPRNMLELLRGLSESEVDRFLFEETVGLGVAVRSDVLRVFGAGPQRHYVAGTVVL